MVTVKQFLDAGFEFVVGDNVDNDGYSFDIDSDRLAIEWNTRGANDEIYVINTASWRKNTGVQPVDDDLWVEILYVDGEKDLALASEFCWGNEDNLTHWKPSLKHLEQQMNDNQETKTALEMSERDIESYADTRCIFEWDGKGIPPVGCECDILSVNDKDVVVGDGKIYHVDGNKVFVISRGITDYPNESTIDNFDQGKSLYVMWINDGDVRFKKKETPEQKAARERMESAYDLYVLANKAAGNGIVDNFDNWRKMSNENMDNYWLAIVDKTGYRKQ